MKNTGRFRMIQLILTAALLLSMCFVWFSGARGALNVNGFSAFLNPVAIASVIMLVAGIVADKKGLCVFGSVLLAAQEIIMYLFWYVLFGQKEVFSLTNSIKYAQPCFYIGFAVTVSVLVFSLLACRNGDNVQEEI